MARDVWARASGRVLSAASGGASGACFTWRTEGHEWIGRRARRFFAEYGAASGVITRWLPVDGDDEALWHMVHDDGDEEDLTESEARKAIEDGGLQGTFSSSIAAFLAEIGIESIAQLADTEPEALSGAMGRGKDDDLLQAVAEARQMELQQAMIAIVGNMSIYNALAQLGITTPHELILHRHASCIVADRTSTAMLAASSAIDIRIDEGLVLSWVQRAESIVQNRSWMFGYVHEDDVEGGFGSWGVASASRKVRNYGSVSGSGSDLGSASASALASTPAPGSVCSMSSSSHSFDSKSASIPGSAAEFSAGLRVRMQGLRTRPDLNGTCGTVTQFSSQSGRYHVKCEKDGEVMAFKPANLRTL